VTPYSQLVEPALAEYYLSRTATPGTPFNRLKASLYRPDVVEALASDIAHAPTSDLFRVMRDHPLLDQMLYVDTKTWLPDDLLVKADKMTMATSVELRVPLLDFQVLEFAASLPQSFKIRGWSGKRILKAALQGSVPQAILDRPKTGFPVPYARWLRTDLRDFVADTVLAPTAALGTYFQSETVRDVVERFHQHGVGSKEVFCLLVLELWLKRFATAPANDAVWR
jgi:asparagine synthase (glutamine-hydrolysing)